MLAHGALLEGGAETDRRYDSSGLFASMAAVVYQACREVQPLLFGVHSIVSVRMRTAILSIRSIMAVRKHIE